MSQLDIILGVFTCPWRAQLSASPHYEPKARLPHARICSSLSPKALFATSSSSARARVVLRIADDVLNRLRAFSHFQLRAVLAQRAPADKITRAPPPTPTRRRAHEAASSMPWPMLGRNSLGLPRLRCGQSKEGSCLQLTEKCGDRGSPKSITRAQSGCRTDGQLGHRVLPAPAP